MLIVDCQLLIVNGLIGKRRIELTAIPNEEMLVTRAEKSDTVGHQIQGANDDQADKDGTDN